MKERMNSTRGWTNITSAAGGGEVTRSGKKQIRTEEKEVRKMKMRNEERRRDIR